MVECPVRVARAKRRFAVPLSQVSHPDTWNTSIFTTPLKRQAFTELRCVLCLIPHQCRSHIHHTHTSASSHKHNTFLRRENVHTQNIRNKIRRTNKWEGTYSKVMDEFITTPLSWNILNRNETKRCSQCRGDGLVH